jgi:hypothetical protein
MIVGFWVSRPVSGPPVPEPVPEPGTSDSSGCSYGGEGNTHTTMGDSSGSCDDGGKDTHTATVTPPPPKKRKLPGWMKGGYDDLSPLSSASKTLKGSEGSTDGKWISAKRNRKNPHPKKYVPKKLPPTVKFNARKKDGSIQLINMRLPDHSLSKTLVKGKNSFDVREFQRLMQDPEHGVFVFVQEVTKTMMTNTNTTKILSRDGGTGAYDYRWYKNGAMSQSLKKSK